MRKNFFLSVFISVISALTGSAQLSDLARIDYTLIPKGSSGIEYRRARVLFNYPIKVKKDTYLLLGLDYSNIDISFDEGITSFDTNEIIDFQLLDLNIGYTFKINETWRFGAVVTPGVSSNLSRGDLSFRDVVFSGDIVLIKDKSKDPTISKPYRLILGISYSENRGIPFPLPFISYYRKFHPKWSFNIGIPKTNLQYHISNQSRLKLFAQLDGFNANIQRDLIVNEIERADNVKMSLILSGLRYEYKFNNRLEFFINGAYLLSNSVQLRNDNSDVITLNNDNKMYYRAGIRFKI
ncbi:DUF6268 family outer membrane beta-barrel protein [uncultured Aquimarina sp.]|uniref:DUF6268 family outer membrane beta-barrel protein n=1 Tax=uncultured Aquimarina sp. TaxID=575652 RepID=UPI00263425FF|nr:DUF6268 family outer membrane beta-barrel protein [uncultured Aquimarina sp.]